MKIYIYFFTILSVFSSFCCYSQALNTTNTDDHNPPLCYDVFLNKSHYWPTCNCEWEAIKNIDDYPCNDKTTIKVFEDNFDGNTLDFNYWRRGFPWSYELNSTDVNYSGMPYGNNVYLQGGNLVLQAKMETVNQGQFGLYWDGKPNPERNYSYTNGVVSSLMSWGYGKFEIRCKMPDNPVYMNSAFWLYGDCANEIDVFETFDDWNDGGIYDQNPKHSHVNMRITTGTFSAIKHCNSEYGGKHGARCHRSYSTKLPVGEYLNQWHTYTLYWDEYSVQLEIDGVNTGEYITSIFKNYPQPSAKLCSDLKNKKDYRKMLSYPYEKDSRMDLILDVAVRYFTQTTALPNYLGNDRKLIIDYVKVWQNETCGQIENLCGQFDDKIMPAIEYGLQVNISPNNCGWTLLGNLGSQSVFSAIGENEVNLYPGFNAEAGSVFSAWIQPCAYTNRMQNPVIDTIYETSIDKQRIDVVKVVPNPNTGSFTVFYPENIHGVLKISNALGLEIFETKIEGDFNEKTVNLKNVSPGFYYVTLETNETTFTSKFIIHD